MAFSFETAEEGMTEYGYEYTVCLHRQHMNTNPQSMIKPTKIGIWKANLQRIYRK